MRYVDGYVLPLPEKNVKAYIKMAQLGKKMWRKFGALDYKECIGDDFSSPWAIPFTKMMKVKRGETVVFAYIVFKSKTHRDQVNTKVIKAMEKMDMPKKMPFDPKRMVYSGFNVVVTS